MENQPSKKVLIFMVVVAVLVTATIVLSKVIDFTPKKEALPEINLTIANQLDNDYYLLDSDNDGLPDWQEELWGTDKNNPDTDGDGATDGDEVALGRNPLLAGPNDKIKDDVEIFQEMAQQMNLQSDPNSQTSILSKNLLLRVAQLKEAGQLNEQTGDQLAQNLVNQVMAEMKIADKYPSHLFFTFADKTPEKLEVYANNLVNIQYEEILQISPDNENLDRLIESFKNIAFKLSTIAVPAELLSVHARLTNNYYLASEALINLKKSDLDPILAILSIPIYRDVSEEQPILFKQMENYLQSNGIIFNNKQN